MASPTTVHYTEHTTPPITIWPPRQQQVDAMEAAYPEDDPSDPDDAFLQAQFEARCAEDEAE